MIQEQIQVSHLLKHLSGMANVIGFITHLVPWHLGHGERVREMTGIVDHDQDFGHSLQVHPIVGIGGNQTYQQT